MATAGLGIQPWVRHELAQGEPKTVTGQMTNGSVVYLTVTKNGKLRYLNVANIDSSARTFRMQKNPTTGTTVYLAYDVSVPVGGVVVFDTPIILLVGDTLALVASANSALEFELGYEEER